VLVQELGHGVRGDVVPDFQETASDQGDGVGMSLEQAGHGVCDALLLICCLDFAVDEGHECGEGVHVVVVDFGDVGIRDDDEGKVAEGLNTVSEAGWEDIEGEIGGLVQGLR